MQTVLKPLPKTMTLEERVIHWNRIFSFPINSEIPMTVFHKGWIYGVWYCGTSFKKAKYYGQYPPHFLDRLLALFPDKKDFLHLCSGTIKQDITLDLDLENKLNPTIRADAQKIPFKPNSFDLIDFDPPYSKRDAEVYYKVPYISPVKAMRECLPILRVGGFFCCLDVRYPSYSRKKGWSLIGLIAVVTGFGKVTRMLSIFRKDF